MEVNVTIKDGVIILKPVGRIMGVTANELGQAIEAHLSDASESPKFLFDFADVPRLDSSGLGKLMALHVSIVCKGGRIGVINVNKPIDHRLTIRSPIAIFEHFDSEAEAIAGLRA